MYCVQWSEVLVAELMVSSWWYEGVVREALSTDAYVVYCVREYML